MTPTLHMYAEFGFFDPETTMNLTPAQRDMLDTMNRWQAQADRDRISRALLSGSIEDIRVSLSNHGVEVELCSGCNRWDVQHHVENMGLDNERNVCGRVGEVEDVELFDEATGPLVPLMRPMGGGR